MLFSEIVKPLSITVNPKDDFEAANVTCSTQKVVKNSVFFAINGTVTDGHIFIEQAYEKGAGAVVGERDLNTGRLYFKTDDTRKAFAVAAAAFYGNPQNDLEVWGVTGTNGKTTVANMLRSISLANGKGCGLVGTIENIAGGKAVEAERTTPDAEALFSLFRKMVDGGDKVCAMEVSSHGLAESRVYGIKFRVGIFTNLTQDHLDFHKTMEAYAEAKSVLMQNSEAAVINADDPWADFFKSRAEKYVTYGIKNKADFMATDIKCTADSVSFNCPLGEIILPPGGYFSVYNALAAACAAHEAGISDEAVIKGLRDFSGVKGRLEHLNTKGKYHVYIDYAHTPDGLENVLNGIKEFAEKKIITVFGCGGDRDKGKRPKMGRIASVMSDFCVVTNDNPRTENPDEIIAGITAGMEGGEYVCIPDRKEAIRYALTHAEDGDIVLLAGKGHETYQIIGTEKRHLDERELVEQVEAEEGM